MWNRFHSWLGAVQLDDPIERQQAPLIQVMLIGLMVANVLGLPLALGTPAAGDNWLLPLGALLLIAVGAVAGVAVIRGGRFRAGVGVATLGLLVGLGVFAYVRGILQQPPMLMSLALPIALAGLLIGRGPLILVLLLATGIVAGVAVPESQSALPDGLGPRRGELLIETIGGFVLIAALLAFFFDRFSGALRQSLAISRARERDLEQMRLTLEEIVARRTAELQRTVDDLRASQATVRELGAPVLPVLPGVLAVPLIGALDSARAADLSAAVLGAIDEQRARHVILDITGVPVVDTYVAHALLQVAQAARLLGAETLLVGIGAEVAQTIAQLQLDLRAIRVYPNLEAAVGALLETRGAVAR
jgi:rsbT co-antagonist protein RsbR